MFDPLTSQPSEVVLYTTSKCNGKCDFCLRTKGLARRRDITPAIIELALDAFPRIQSACVAGFGEPLLTEGLREIIDLLHRRGVYNGLITNGMLVEEKWDTVPWEKVGHVTVSVNAVDAEDHEATFHVPNGFALMRAGLDRLAAARIPTMASFVVGKWNWEKVPEYLETAHALGVRAAVVVNTLPHGDVFDPEYCRAFKADDVITIEDDEIIEAGVEWRLLAKELGLTVHAWPVPIDIGDGGCPSFCQSPFSRIGIDGDGSITGCIRVIPPSPEFGNIDEGPLVWARSEHLRDLRLGLTGRKDMHPACALCFGNWIRE